jgi:hypothetical protein
MNLVNVEITRITQPVPDWNVKGDVVDDAGNVLSTFGVDGTSVNNWWNSQSQEFQIQYVSIFMSIMAQQSVGAE